MFTGDPPPATQPVPSPKKKFFQYILSFHILFILLRTELLDYLRDTLLAACDIHTKQNAMKRTIIAIDEDLCNGCELCIEGCHEGALQMIDGKARMVSDLYCDGLGACIPECPTGAITLEEREAEPYDEIKVMERIAPKGEATILAHLNHLADHNQMEYVQQGISYIREHKLPVDLTKVRKLNGSANAGGFSFISAGLTPDEKNLVHLQMPRLTAHALRAGQHHQLIPEGQCLAKIKSHERKGSHHLYLQRNFTKGDRTSDPGKGIAHD